MHADGRQTTGQLSGLDFSGFGIKSTQAIKTTQSYSVQSTCMVKHFCPEVSSSLTMAVFTWHESRLNSSSSMKMI